MLNIKPHPITRPLSAILMAISTLFIEASYSFAQTPPPLLAAPVADPYVYKAAPNDHIIGSIEAPHELIIYASVTCSHCSNWFGAEWPSIKGELIDSGKLRVAFREFVTAPPQIAALGFSLANCAPESDYFDVIALQMEQQKQIFSGLGQGQGLAAYKDVLLKLGLESEAEVELCLQNPDHQARLHKAADRAQATQLESVPGFVLNGQKTSGDLTFERLKALTEE